jgi:predicted porin
VKKQLSAAIALALSVPMAASAAPTLYGKANVSYASTSQENDLDGSDVSKLDVASNASRIGIKGTETINDNLEAIYQAEFEVAFDDGDAKGGNVFSQRNIYVGVKGNFGTVIAGHFDTPLKTSQKKIDLFNDLYGDIKGNFTINDNRKSNSLMYATPDLSGFKLYADIIASEQDNDGLDEDEKRSNATSIAATYERNGFYGALAYDLDVEAESTSTLRAVFQYNVSSFQFGLMAEEFEKQDKEKVNGVFGSVQYKINDWALKAQYGQSDINEEDGTTLSLGADYKMSKNSKVYGFYTSNSYLAGKNELGAELDADESYLGLGIEVKF